MKSSKPIHILFLCVANSARSQLAEGLAKSMFGESAVIESAGSNPSGAVQPWAVKSLAAIGIDISQNYSKSYDELSTTFLNNLDFVITLCAEEVCPTMISKAKKLHWPTPDPARVPETQKEMAFNEARDAIKNNLSLFIKELQSTL